jgi:hypothetical protein
MNTIEGASVTIQTSSESVPAVPVWFEEVVVLSSYLGVPTFFSPKIPAKDSARRFGLVFSPLSQKWDGLPFPPQAIVLTDEQAI